MWSLPIPAFRSGYPRAIYHRNRKEIAPPPAQTMTDRELSLMEFPEVAYWVWTSAIEAREVRASDLAFKEFSALYFRLRRSVQPRPDVDDPAVTAHLSAYGLVGLGDHMRWCMWARNGASSDSFTTKGVQLTPEFKTAMTRAGRHYSVPGDWVESCCWHEGTYSLLVRLATGRVLHIVDQEARLIQASSDRFGTVAQDGRLWIPSKDKLWTADDLKAWPETVELSGQHVFPLWKPTGRGLDGQLTRPRPGRSTTRAVPRSHVTKSMEHFVGRERDEAVLD